MSFLIPGLRRGLILSSPLIVSTPILLRQLNRPVLCDSPNAFTNAGPEPRISASYTDTGSLKQSGAINPKVVRQISMGSILGVLGGLGISVFSKPLALLIGLGIVLVQFLDSRGIHVIPYSYLQKRVKQTNVRSMLLANPAFKISFGLTLALSAFAEF